MRSSSRVRVGGVCVFWATAVIACASESAEPELQRIALATEALAVRAGPTRGATPEAPVGLALDIENGVGQPLAVRAGQRFFVDQIDIRATLTAERDEGVDGLKREGDFAGLDWRGLELRDVEPVPTPNPDGTFTRRRFYRGARWMEGDSALIVEQLDGAGRLQAPPWSARIGTGDRARPSDEFFVRRLRAIQYSDDCATPVDCSSATHYLAEALVELRHAVRAGPALALQPRTTVLRVRWLGAGRPREYTIPLTQVSSPRYSYGFGIEIDALTPPSADGTYEPGSALAFRVTYRDGAGQRLHPQGALPTYVEAASDEAGLQYWNPGERVATYWRRKHREHQMVASITGPAQQIQAIRSPLGAADLASPDGVVTSGVLERDGVFAQAWSFPSFLDLLTGNLSAPISDEFHFQLPANAPPGTYLVTVKARRHYLGQQLPLSQTIEIQVGSPRRTEADLGTGPCASCHRDRSGLEHVLHGNANRATCATCHVPLEFEPEGPVAVRVHFIHSRSGRFDAPLAGCASCHLDRASIQRTSQSACLSCHTSYPADHVARFGPVSSAYVGGPIDTAFQRCTDGCHRDHPGSGL